MQKFEPFVTVSLESSGVTTIKDAQEGVDLLLKRWPGKRGDKHRAALQACVDAGENHNKGLQGARRALVAAAREAGVLVTDR